MEFVGDTKLGRIEGGGQHSGMDTIYWKMGLPSRGTYLGYRYGPAGTSQNSAKTNAKSLTQEEPNLCTGPYQVTDLLCTTLLMVGWTWTSSMVWQHWVPAAHWAVEQPVVWGKGSVPSTWRLLHITWRAYSVSSSSSFSFGTRHMLINLIIFSGELPPGRLGLE